MSLYDEFELHQDKITAVARERVRELVKPVVASLQQQAGLQEESDQAITLEILKIVDGLADHMTVTPKAEIVFATKQYENCGWALEYGSSIVPSIRLMSKVADRVVEAIEHEIEQALEHGKLEVPLVPKPRPVTTVQFIR